jgi:hypothetical protein
VHRGPFSIVTAIVTPKSISGQATTDFRLSDCHIVTAKKVQLAARYTAGIYTRIILLF